ncbi:hypothetical protein EDC01DRAFT_251973 [Geopyxis carbonaria]|nr:hypothetical protein EDC01DRAFT_251973 [Geopyxis carbonaria]
MSSPGNRRPPMDSPNSSPRGLANIPHLPFPVQPDRSPEPVRPVPESFRQQFDELVARAGNIADPQLRSVEDWDSASQATSDSLRGNTMRRHSIRMRERDTQTDSITEQLSNIRSAVSHDMSYMPLWIEIDHTVRALRQQSSIMEDPTLVSEILQVVHAMQRLLLQIENRIETAERSGIGLTNRPLQRIFNSSTTQEDNENDAHPYNRQPLLILDDPPINRRNAISQSRREAGRNDTSILEPPITEEYNSQPRRIRITPGSFALFEQLRGTVDLHGQSFEDAVQETGFFRRYRVPLPGRVRREQIPHINAADAAQPNHSEERPRLGSNRLNETRALNPEENPPLGPMARGSGDRQRANEPAFASFMDPEEAQRAVDRVVQRHHRRSLRLNRGSISEVENPGDILRRRREMSVQEELAVYLNRAIEALDIDGED